MRNGFLALLLATAGLQAAELAVSVGVGPSKSVSTPIGTFSGVDSTATFLVDAGGKLIGLGPISLGWDVPLAIGGPSRAELSAGGSGIYAYADRMQFAVTPGVKARLGLGLLSPWVSFGIGGARLDQASASILSGDPITGTLNANRWAFALSPAGGIDFKPIPILFLRGEVRSYAFRTPEQLFNGNSQLRSTWRNNVLFLGGIGARF